MSEARRSPSPAAILALALLLGLVTALSSIGACAPDRNGEAARGPAPAAAAKEAPVPGADAERALLGDGFVVWESNRGGDWRIWQVRLDGSGLRRLSPDEPGRQHCCPHVSPDGTRVAYLSRPGGRDEYLKGTVPGALHLIRLDGGPEPPVETLAGEARTYGWGDRAAVWKSDHELIYVGGDGRTYLLDLATKASRALTTEPRGGELAWLIDATLRHATTAAPSFSLYDAARRRVLERRELGGCEPYFSHDGRWGVYISGAGGPIDKMDLASRETSIVLEKNDPRLGAKGYLYFPMLSRDGGALAFGASAGEHSHFTADYDVFVVRTDPETVEVLGPPVRITRDPATDRYPDVFLAPLALGRLRGEAPFAVRLRPEGLAGAPEWSWGDGAGGHAAVGEHTYRRPGTYRLRATAGGRELRGVVVVEPGRPPAVHGVELGDGGRTLSVHFDEPVRIDGARFSLDSGRAVTGRRLEDGGRTLVLALAESLGRPDRLRLAGVTDRARPPHAMAPAALEIEPPLWPATRDALVFLWQTGNSPNLVYDPAIGGERSVTLEARGRAHLDHDYAMALAGGAYVAPPEAGKRLLAAVEASNELTLEAQVTPAEAAPAGFRPIVTFSSGPSRRNFTLAQEGRRLVVRLRTGQTGADADRPEVPLFPVRAGEPVHVTVTYSPGRLVVYRNGERVLTSDAIQGSFGMHWSLRRLLFGREWRDGGDWAGALEGVALYSRVLAPEVVRESALRYRRLVAARPRVPRLAVRARLVASSAIPTLREISPYRRALAVFDYRVVEGPPELARGARLRVARWVILDGETLSAAGAGAGRVEGLELEPFEDNPQLDGVYLSDTLGPAPGPLYYALEP